MTNHTFNVCPCAYSDTNKRFERLKEVLDNTPSLKTHIPDIDDKYRNVSKFRYGKWCNIPYIFALDINYLSDIKYFDSKILYYTNSNTEWKELVLSDIVRDNKYDGFYIYDFEIYKNDLVIIIGDISFKNFKIIRVTLNDDIPEYEELISSTDDEEYLDMTIIGDTLYVLTNKCLLPLQAVMPTYQHHGYIGNFNTDIITMSRCIYFDSNTVVPDFIVRNNVSNDVVLIATDTGDMPFFYKLTGNNLYMFVDTASYKVNDAIFFSNEFHENNLLVYGDDDKIHIINNFSNINEPTFTDFIEYDGLSWGYRTAKFQDGLIWIQHLVFNKQKCDFEPVYAISLNGINFDTIPVCSSTIDIKFYDVIAVEGVIILSSSRGCVVTPQACETTYIENVCEHVISDLDVEMFEIDNLSGHTRLLIDLPDVLSERYDIKDINVHILSIPNVNNFRINSVYSTIITSDESSVDGARRVVVIDTTEIPDSSLGKLVLRLSYNLAT